MGRLVKQFLYGMFYLVVFIGIFFLVYRSTVKTPASCFDKVQNQGEAGVDCGSVCGGICLPTDFEALKSSEPIAVLRVPGSSAVSLVGRVLNPNATIAARSFRYVFSLLDASGTLVQSFDGTSFIYAGEFKYIVLPNIAPVSVSTQLHAELSVSDPVWVNREDFSRPDILVQNSSTNILEDTMQTTGTLFNNGATNISRVMVVALFSGVGGVLGVSTTELENLSSGESRSFTITHPLIPNIDLARTQVFLSAVR